MCNRAFLTVEAGKLLIIMSDDAMAQLSADVTADALAERFASLGITSVMCSSSIDFPEEYGAPATLTDTVQEALNMIAASKEGE